MTKLNLRCKADKRKGIWLLAKVHDTYASFMYEDYKNEKKYINSLSDEDKIWLQTFLQGYYHQSKPAMDKLKFPVMMRRSRYNQHRGAKADIFNKRNLIDVSTVWFEELCVESIEREKSLREKKAKPKHKRAE